MEEDDGFASDQIITPFKKIIGYYRAPSGHKMLEGQYSAQTDGIVLTFDEGSDFCMRYHVTFGSQWFICQGETVFYLCLVNS